MMDDKKVDESWVRFSIVVVSATLGFLIGMSSTMARMTTLSEVVQKGHGIWKAAPDGLPVFEWAPACVNHKPDNLERK